MVHEKRKTSCIGYGKPIRQVTYQQEVVIQSDFVHILKSYIQFLFALVSYTLHVVYA